MKNNRACECDPDFKGIVQYLADSLWHELNPSECGKPDFMGHFEIIGEGIYKEAEIWP